MFPCAIVGAVSQPALPTCSRGWGVKDAVHVILFICLFTIACGATIITDDDGGAITTPRYPALYPPNQNCSWIIQAQEPCELQLVSPQIRKP